MTRNWILAAFAVCLIGGLLLAAPSAISPRETLLRTDRDFAKASAERGHDAWVDFFADDSVVFPGSGPIVHGLPAIREQWESAKFSPAGLKWKPEHAEVAASGDLGCTFGYWEKPGTDEKGAPILQKGKYLTVWRKQHDGRWKVVADMGSTDSPPPAKPVTTPEAPLRAPGGP